MSRTCGTVLAEVRMRWMVLLVVAVGCEPEQCEKYDPDLGLAGISCERIDICCAGDECAYVTKRGDRYECLSGIACNNAATDVVCDVCDLEPEAHIALGCGGPMGPEHPDPYARGVAVR